MRLPAPAYRQAGVGRDFGIYPVRNNAPLGFESQRLEFLTGFTNFFNQHPRRLVIPKNWFSLFQEGGHSFLKIFGLVNLPIDLRILHQCLS